MTDPVERLKGRKIVNVRSMYRAELVEFGWNEDFADGCFYRGVEGDAVVIELDDGSLLVPSRDAELNGGGHLVHAVPFVDHPEELGLFGIFSVVSSTVTGGFDV